MKHKLFGFPFLFFTLVFAGGVMAGPAAVEEGMDAAGLVARGDSLWEAGDLDAAMAQFRAAAEADPRSLEARMRIGGLLLAKNDFTGAVKAFQQAIGIDPNNAKGFIALGIAYMHGDNDGPAYAAFEEAIRLDPSRADELRPVMASIEERGGRSRSGASHPGGAPVSGMGLGFLRP